MQANLIKQRPSPKNYQDLSGRLFGQLTVINRAPSGRNWQVRWVCLCSCGAETVVYATILRSGRTKSCGCLRRKGIHRHTSKLGGKSLTYNSWQNMLSRASYAFTDPNYKYYEGVQVCERWHKFENFLADMGERPSRSHTLDRYPNNKGDYKPGNVRWATKGEQNRNFSRNVNITFNGETMCIMDWASRIGIGAPSLKKRLRRWPLERAMTEPRTERCVHPPYS